MQLPIIALSLAFVFALNLFPAQAATRASRRNNPEKPAAALLMGSGEIDQRIATVEAELARLALSLESLRQDSAKVAAEALSLKASALAKTAPVESLYAQKVQALTALKGRREKARQDSIALATKKNSRIAAQKQESDRADATILSASNQLNAFSTKRQQIPAEEPNGENRELKAMERDISRADSAIAALQARKPILDKKRELIHRDSLAEEAKASEARGRFRMDLRKVDSLLQLPSGSQTDAVARQAKRGELTGSAAREQTKLDENLHTKAVLDAQIARTKGEIVSMNAERDRLLATAGAARKKLDKVRAPLAAALTDAEAKLKEKTDEKDGLASLGEKVRLDSAIQKAKDALNSAIEQQAVGKKGAEKLVSQREAEVADLMGRLDDVVRKNPNLSPVSGRLSGLSTTAEKRKRLDSLAALITVDIAMITAQRDRAKRSMEDFDRAHPAEASGRAQTLLDSLINVKEKAAADMAARRDSVENQIAASQRTVEMFRASARVEASKADSEAAVAQSQRSDLLGRRARAMADSIKNESEYMVALIKVRTEQSAIMAQGAAIDRDMANLGALKHRLTQSGVEVQNRAAQLKAAHQLERKRLDSLIDVKEREVTQLSIENEKTIQQSQAALKDIDALIQKQAALIVELQSQITQAEQDLSAVSRQVDAARKQSGAEESAAQEKIRAIERDKAGSIAALTVKKTELAQLKNQREALRRSLAAEVMRLDSMVLTAGKVIASYEGAREKAKRDSAAAEGAKSDGK